MASPNKTEIQTVFHNKNYNGKILKQVFQCTKCGCKVCDRPSDQVNLTFLEGFYVCRNCKREVVYFDSDFISTEVQSSQLSLDLFNQ